MADDGWRATDKDELENRLKYLVCSGQIPLIEAQRAIAGNWENAYTQYVTNGEQ